MNIISASILLFGLNLLDALLTIIWVRNGVATEGNLLMAALLDVGDYTFLGAKLAIGAFAAFMFLRYGDRSRLGKFGISLVLVVYISLMGVHFMTGLTAFGLVSASTFEQFEWLEQTVRSFLV